MTHVDSAALRKVEWRIRPSFAPSLERRRYRFFVNWNHVISTAAGAHVVDVLSRFYRPRTGGLFIQPKLFYSLQEAFHA
jgi:hypothetical protein